MKLRTEMPVHERPFVAEDGQGGYVISFGPYFKVEIDQEAADTLAYEITSAIARTLNP